MLKQLRKKNLHNSVVSNIEISFYPFSNPSFKMKNKKSVSTYASVQVSIKGLDLTACFSLLYGKNVCFPKAQTRPL